MQTWLSVEQDSVTIGNVAFNDIADRQLICDLASICVLQRNLDRAISCDILMNLHIISAGMVIGTVAHELSQALDIVPINSVGVSQNFRH